MKLKNLSLAIFSALMLSACGGGSSSNSNGGKTGTGTGTGTGNTTLTKPDFQQWSSFYIDEYSDSDLNYEIEQLTFDQGNIYIKVDETTGWDESETFYLTENGLYDHGSTHATYGKLQGTITANATTWKQVPYSPINSTGLSSTLTFKVFDISSKNIAQVLSPEHYVNLKYNLLDTYPMGEKGEDFYRVLSNSIFPTGSTCIQFQTIDNSQKYIELYKYSLEDYVQDYLKLEWADISKDSKYAKHTFKDAIAYLDLREDQQWGLAEYKSKYYEVDYHPAGEKYNIKNILAASKALVNSASAQDKPALQEYATLQENACTLFNNIASEELRKQIKKYS